MEFENTCKNVRSKKIKIRFLLSVICDLLSCFLFSVLTKPYVSTKKGKTQPKNALFTPIYEFFREKWLKLLPKE